MKKKTKNYFYKFAHYHDSDHIYRSNRTYL